MTLDVYTPWREPFEALKRRHVGRSEIDQHLLSAARRHVDGGKPLHAYLFGPRGAGKSHLLAVHKPAIEALARDAGRLVLSLPEDLPELQTCTAVRGRLLEHTEGPAWAAWNRTTTMSPERLRGAIVLFEGFDRQVRAMSELERRALRKLIQEEEIWVVATGVSLSDPVVAQDAAFYGFFSTWPVEGLAPPQAAALLDSLAGPAVQRTDWSARRRALVGLAGGSPRTLVALAGSCSSSPEALASDHLHAVVRQFTAHYQLRFRDLSSVGQRVIELVTRSPRELSPGEIAEALGSDPRTVGVQMRRLADDGVLVARQEGRHTWYTVAEPLFRFWYEYRTAPWDETRVGWLARLIEEVLTPQELSRAWLDNPDLALRAPIEEVLGRNPDAAAEAWYAACVRMRGADEDVVLDLLSRMDALRVGPQEVANGFLDWMASRATSGHHWWSNRCTQHPELRPLASSLVFYRRVVEDGQPPKAAFTQLLREVDGVPTDQQSVASACYWWLTRTFDVLQYASPTGRPWKLTSAQRSILSAFPGARALFLTRGKFRGHQPLIEPDGVLAAIGSTPADAPWLVAGAQLWRHSALFAAAVHSASWLTANPMPAVPAPGSADRATMLSGASVLDGVQEVALTWTATWADASTAVFDQVVAAFENVHSRRNSDLNWAPSRAALIALGVRSPERLAALRDAARDPKLKGLLVEAVAMSDQLREGQTARLHPELQALLDLDRPPGFGGDGL